jgi:hypothetical protein
MHPKEFIYYAVAVFFMSLLAGMIFRCVPRTCLDNSHFEAKSACVPCGVEAVVDGHAICKCDYGIFGVEYRRVDLE